MSLQTPVSGFESPRAVHSPHEEEIFHLASRVWGLELRLLDAQGRLAETQDELDRQTIFSDRCTQLIRCLFENWGAGVHTDERVFSVLAGNAFRGYLRSFRAGTEQLRWCHPRYQHLKKVVDFAVTIVPNAIRW